MGLFGSRVSELPYGGIDFPSEDAVRTGGDFDGPESIALRRLEPIVGRDMIGVPFGPGMGLEAALKVAAPLEHAHPVQLLGMVRILEEEVGKRTIRLEDWDEVLGHTPGAVKRYGVSRDAYAECIERLGRFKKAGHEIAAESGPEYDRWCADRAWAVEAWSGRP